MSSASWLVGYFTVPAMSLSNFDGDDINVAAGTYCLRHTTAALSFLDVLNAAIDDSLSAITCTSLVILRNRLVQINLSAPGDLNFATGTINGDVLAAVLGFDATDHTGASSYTAEHVSPYLFSAGFMATPSTPQGTDGRTIPHQSSYKSDDATQIYTVRYGTETWQDLSWAHILPERMMVDDSSDQGGTFKAFWDAVASYPGRRFFYYEEIDEDDTSSSAVTWTTGRGPYSLRDVDPDWYRRNVANAELSNSLDLPLIKLAEVS